MHRKHATLIALVLALAAVAAVYAGLKTTEIGAASAATTSSQGQIAQRNAQLDRAEAALKRAAKQRPPALPPLPARPAAPAVPAVQVQTRTALPVVQRSVTVVRAHEAQHEVEIEHEVEHEHGGEDHGGHGHDGDDD